MPTKRTRKRGTQTYPQSEGNVALADEAVRLLQTPKTPPPPPQLRLVPNILTEDPDAHTLEPATELVVAIGLSIMLCHVIMLVISWIR
jgi:hypothetical protein